MRTKEEKEKSKCCGARKLLCPDGTGKTYWGCKNCLKTFVPDYSVF